MNGDFNGNTFLSGNDDNALAQQTKQADCGTAEPARVMEIYDRFVVVIVS